MIRAVLRGLRRQLKSDVMDLCQLEADEGEADFALASGGFATFYEAVGSYGAVSDAGAAERVGRLVARLEASLRAPGIRLQAVFSRLPELAESRVRDALGPTLGAAERLGLEVGGLLEARIAALSERVAEERCVLVLSTLPESLTDVELKSARRRAAEALRRFDLPARLGEYAMSPNVGLGDLRRAHAANRRMLESAFSGVAGLEPMRCADAMLSLRGHIAPTGGPKWRPRLLGGRPAMRVVREVEGGMDGSCLFTPPIAHQLFTDAPEAREGLVRLGGRWHGTLSMDMLPAAPEPFAGLFRAVPDGIPWQVSITLTSGHEDILGKLKLKEALASVIAWTASQNRSILEAMRQLQDYARQGVLVACQVQAATSGRSPEEVRDRLSVLVRALESWGGPSVVADRGDPVEAWLSAQPGFTPSSVAPPCAAPLAEAVTICPFLRPRAPWRRGGALLRTVDNRLFPVAQGGALQALSSDLVFAPPGAGKSLKLAADNLSLLCDPANEAVPRIAIIDVGYSASLFIDLVREVLPEGQRHLAQSFTFRQEEGAEAINPLDTPLGCPFPPAMDRSWMVSFLTLLLSPAGAREAPERLAEFVSQAVDETYAHFAPGANAKEYDPAAAPEAVARAVERVGLEVVDGRTSWWQVVDGLFRAGDVHAATLAQRFAVPTLQDIPAALNASTALRDLDEGARIGGESPISYMVGMISLAVRDNPALGRPSSFAVSQARVVAVDLAQVAQGGSGRGDKQTALYYLLARQMLCAGFYRDEESVGEVPDLYRQHHLDAVRADQRAVKRICYDEFHRTRGSRQVREQVVRDIREGRKYGVRICLVSQLLDDFDDDMVELATNIWVMGQPSSKLGVEQIARRFKPSDDAMADYERHVTGPSRHEGSSMLYLGRLDNVAERVEQVLRLTLGAAEVWAYSTTPQDVALRRELVRRMGFAQAIARLAERFPGGSAVSWIEAQDEGGARDPARLADLIALEAPAPG